MKRMGKQPANITPPMNNPLPAAKFVRDGFQFVELLFRSMKTQIKLESMQLRFLRIQKLSSK